MEALRGEITEKQEIFDQVDLSRLDTRRKVVILELANRTLHSERDNIQFATEAKEDIHEDRIRELGKENSKLLERASASEVEKARLLEWVFAIEAESSRMAERPSTSYASEFPNIPWDMYEYWILAEARFDVICDLKKTGCDF